MSIKTVFWSVPKIWPNSTVYIIGGGPSIRETDLSPLYDKHCIGVNNAFKLGNWIDVNWWGDNQWWEDYQSQLATWAGLKVHCCSRNRVRPDTKRLLRGQPQGIDPRPSHIAWNGNSGGSAINLAVHFGAKRIVLVGFDMKFGKFKENNWHNDHKKLGPKWDPYPLFLKNFPYIHRDATALDIEIINANPDSALEDFPKRKLEDCL